MKKLNEIDIKYLKPGLRFKHDNGEVAELILSAKSKFGSAHPTTIIMKFSDNMIDSFHHKSIRAKEYTFMEQS